MKPAATLTATETQHLRECETIIEAGLESFIAVGNAFKHIVATRLYRDEYESFEEYCRARWSVGKDYAYRLISAATTAEKVSPIVSISNEAQARELAALPPDKQIEAAKEVAATVVNRKPTAKDFARAAKRVSQQMPPAEYAQEASIPTAPAEPKQPATEPVPTYSRQRKHEAMALVEKALDIIEELELDESSLGHVEMIFRMCADKCKQRKDKIREQKLNS